MLSADHTHPLHFELEPGTSCGRAVGVCNEDINVA